MVAVLDIHMLSTAAAAMKPITRPRALPPPNRFTMNRAIRRCAPESAMAVDSMKPPISSRIRGLPKAWPTCAGVSTPNSGKIASGIRDVNGIGTGSKTHQIAHSSVTAAVIAAATDQPLADQQKEQAQRRSGCNDNEPAATGSLTQINLFNSNLNLCAFFFVVL